MNIAQIMELCPPFARVAHTRLEADIAKEKLCIIALLNGAYPSCGERNKALWSLVNIPFELTDEDARNNTPCVYHAEDDAMRKVISRMGFIVSCNNCTHSYCFNLYDSNYDELSEYAELAYGKSM